MSAHRPPGSEAGRHRVPPPWRNLPGGRLYLFIGLVCAALVVGVWVTTLQRIAFEHAQARAAAMHSNASLAIALEQHVFRTLKAAEQVTAFVREQYLQQGTTLDLQRWIEHGVFREQLFTIVSVVDADGNIVRSSQKTGSVNYADRDFFRAQVAATDDVLFVDKPVLGRVSRRWQIPMSLRIARPDGSFGGVVVLSVDPAGFTGFASHADLGQQGLVEFTGLDGVVRGRKVGTHSSFGKDASDLAWFQRQAAEPEGTLIDDGLAIDGVARIVGYRTVADYPLMVAIGTAEADALAPVLQRRTSYLAIALLATAAVLCSAVLLVWGLARRRSAADALRASESLFRATFHQAATGIAHVAPDGSILRGNEKFCSMLGYTQDELRGLSLLDLSDVDGRDEARKFLEHRLSAGLPLLAPELEKTYRRKDGSLLWVSEALGLVRGVRGEPDFLVAVTQDITARKELQSRLSRDALHDALTGLPNRVMFQDRLARVLESARRHGRLAAVLYVDLDGFKAVNDSRGHAAGDLLLQQVARRLEGCVRAEDTVSRLGGDEFGIVLATMAHEHDCERVADKVIKTLSEPFEVEHQTVQISASVGAALFPLHGDDTAALVAHADLSMFAAKREGKNRFSREPIPRVQDA